MSALSTLVRSSFGICMDLMCICFDCFFCCRALSKEQEVSYRLNLRRLGIIKLILREHNITTPHEIDGAVWADGKILRRFLSCTDTLHDILSDPKVPVLQQTQFLRDDGFLHPRTSRLGKLLSEKTFLTYILLLGTEKQLILKQPWHTMSKEKLCDSIIYCNKIKCESITKHYQRELGEKLNNFRLMVKLYHVLDRTADGLFAVANNDEELFAVTRSFTTNFRRFVLKLMKDATSGEKMGAGIDCFEIYDLTPWLDPEYDIDKHCVDPVVNGKILCEYFFS